MYVSVFGFVLFFILYDLKFAFITLINAEFCRLQRSVCLYVHACVCVRKRECVCLLESVCVRIVIPLSWAMCCLFILSCHAAWCWSSSHASTQNSVDCTVYVWCVCVCVCVHVC